MSFLYITEFQTMPFTDNAVGHTWGLTPPLAEQKVTISATLSTGSSAFNVNTRFVRLSVDSGSACNVAFAPSGATIAATASNMHLAASSFDYFGVQGAGALSVIGNAA